MWFDAFDTPIGTMTVAADEAGLRHVLFPDNKYPPAGREGWRRDAAALRGPREQLLAYFAGERQDFELVLAPMGTPFQVKVWTMLAAVPFGQTWSYGELARRIGEPRAVRAVGAANGRNPLPVVLPCHRIIGSDGSLTGFGGGLPLKTFLLEHEGARPRGFVF
jgi:methylated-DNA-[protein]-cysteine S-methyltransferase